jgi:hypothetical protein
LGGDPPARRPALDQRDLPAGLLVAVMIEHHNTERTNYEITERSAQDRRLWCAVILQAIEDATSDAPIGTSSRGLNREMTKRDARAWLLEPNRDFGAACDLAGVDPDHVRAYACRLIEEADQRRADSTAQPRKRETNITFNGRTMNIAAWAKETGISEVTLRGRLRRGLQNEEHLTPPSARMSRKRATARGIEGPGGGFQLPAEHRGPARGASREISPN